MKVESSKFVKTFSHNGDEIVTTTNGSGSDTGAGAGSGSGSDTGAGAGSGSSSDTGAGAGKWWEKPVSDAISGVGDILKTWIQGKNTVYVPTGNTGNTAPDNTALYVGIGGTLVFLVIILVLLKK